MPPKILIAIFAFIVLAICHPAQAQQPTKFFRLGYLSNTNPDSELLRSESIRLALRERGYIEGQNYAIVYRYADQNAERGREIAAELAALKVDVILVVGGSTWVRAVKNATKTIPIVMMNLPIDPVRARLVV